MNIKFSRILSMDNGLHEQHRIAEKNLVIPQFLHKDRFHLDKASLDRYLKWN